METLTINQVIAFISEVKLKQIVNQGEFTSISYDVWVAMLMHKNNDAYDPMKLQQYQDMSQPLSNYYIASSHNTYLEGDQLTSKSSVNRYIDDLCNNCRCVELDCWDGDNGEPIIYHGHTLTSKIKFEDVVLAIKNYAFKTNPYPVILSIENHCNVEQQKRMAQIFKKTLGKMIVPRSVETMGEFLPSPDDLKYKILIKGKRHEDFFETDDAEDEMDDDNNMFGDEDAGMTMPTFQGETDVMSMSSSTSAAAIVTPDLDVRRPGMGMGMMSGSFSYTTSPSTSSPVLFAQSTSMSIKDNNIGKDNNRDEDEGSVLMNPVTPSSTASGKQQQQQQQYHVNSKVLAKLETSGSLSLRKIVTSVTSLSHSPSSSHRHHHVTSDTAESEVELDVMYESAAKAAEESIASENPNIGVTMVEASVQYHQQSHGMKKGIMTMEHALKDENTPIPVPVMPSESSYLDNDNDNIDNDNNYISLSEEKRKNSIINNSPITTDTTPNLSSDPSHVGKFPSNMSLPLPPQLPMTATATADSSTTSPITTTRTDTADTTMLLHMIPPPSDIIETITTREVTSHISLPETETRTADGCHVDEITLPHVVLEETETETEAVILVPIDTATTTTATATPDLSQSQSHLQEDVPTTLAPPAVSSADINKKKSRLSRIFSSNPSTAGANATAMSLAVTAASATAGNNSNTSNTNTNSAQLARLSSKSTSSNNNNSNNMNKMSSKVSSRGTLSTSRTMALGPKKPKNPFIADELSEITFIGGIKFNKVRGFNDSGSIPCELMSSFRETDVVKLLIKPNNNKLWIRYNMKHLSRIYPKGSRVDSSNMDPMPSWNSGCQLVALNYQTPSLPMQLNFGKFRENGCRGYVLKPPYMLAANNGSDESITVTVHIISVQNIPRLASMSKDSSMYPSVTINVHGATDDYAEVSTKIVERNGFNPIWDEVFTFDVNTPEIAQLTFRVYLQDELLDSKSFVAYSSIPLHCLRPGLRNVPLFDEKGSQKGDFAFAYLFIRVGYALLEKSHDDW
eukprot:gene1699-3292_t